MVALGEEVGVPSPEVEGSHPAPFKLADIPKLRPITPSGVIDAAECSNRSTTALWGFHTRHELRLSHAAVIALMLFTCC